MVDGLRHPDEWLKELAADRCSQVREHLLFLKQRAAQSQAAAILADTVSHVLYSIESELKAAPSPRADEESKFRLTEIHDFLNYLSEDLLRLIEEGESTRIPGEMILPLQRAVNDLLPATPVLVRSTSEVNYVYEEVAASIRRAFEYFGYGDALAASFPDRMVSLSVANVPPLGVLTHTAMFHELGHALWSKHEAAKRFTVDIRQDDVDKLVEQERRSFQAVSSSPPTVPEWVVEAEIREQLTEVVMRWIEETVCDMVAVSLGGPAYLANLCYFMLPTEDAPESGSESHPPMTYRCKEVARVTKEAFGKIAFEPMVSSLTALEGFTDQLAIHPGEPLLDVALGYVQSYMSAISECAQELTKGSSYSAASVETQVPGLVDRLLDGVPPNEYWDAATDAYVVPELASIMSAAWLVFCWRWSKWTELTAGMTEADGKRRFYKLVANGIEQSEIHRRWAEGQDNG